MTRPITRPHRSGWRTSTTPRKGTRRRTMHGTSQRGPTVAGVRGVNARAAGLFHFRNRAATGA